MNKFTSYVYLAPIPDLHRLAKLGKNAICTIGYLDVREVLINTIHLIIKHLGHDPQSTRNIKAYRKEVRLQVRLHLLSVWIPGDTVQTQLFRLTNVERFHTQPETSPLPTYWLYEYTKTRRQLLTMARDWIRVVARNPGYGIACLGNARSWRGSLKNWWLPRP